MRLCLIRRCRPRGDAGVGIVLAVMVALLAMSLSLLVAQVAVGVGRDSGVDRQRTVAVSAAEAGVDAAVAAIAGGGANPPCRWPASGTTDVGSYPDTTTVSATIAYTDAAGTALPCVGGAVSGTAATATITATAATQTLGGGSTRGRRSMRAVVQLASPSGPLTGAAMFGQTGVSISNSLSLTTDAAAPPADVYTNGDFYCGGTTSLAGTVYAQGKATFDCSTVAGDGWSGGLVIAYQGIHIRSIKTAGDFNIDGGASISGTVVAGGTRTGTGSYSCPSPQCLQNQGPSVPGKPPAQAFQRLEWTSTTESTWQANGWTIVRRSTCGESPTQWVNDNAATLSSKTALVTNCAVNLTQSLTLRNDLAVVSFGGFTLSGASISSSSPGTLRRLYGIVPANATLTTPCSGLTTSTSQQVTTTGIDLLLYTPCDITLNNRGVLQGQVYAGGTVNASNNFTLNYHAVPAYGVTGSGTSYLTSLQQKYEVGPTSSP